MGSVPLLTRESEVVIAKRIERGQLVVLKAITLSPIVIKEIIAVGEGLHKGVRSIKELFSSMMKSSPKKKSPTRLSRRFGKLIKSLSSTKPR